MATTLDTRRLKRPKCSRCLALTQQINQLNADIGRISNQLDAERESKQPTVGPTFRRQVNKQLLYGGEVRVSGQYDGITMDIDPHRPAVVRVFVSEEVTATEWAAIDHDVRLLLQLGKEASDDE